MVKKDLGEDFDMFSEVMEVPSANSWACVGNSACVTMAAASLGTGWQKCMPV